VKYYDKGNFSQFLMDGLATLRSDARFRLFLHTQWPGDATLMALLQSVSALR
jgi:hypothetical protein